MPQVSRPLLAVLTASVLLLAVWMVALRPSSSTTTSTAGTSAAPAVAAPATVPAGAAAHAATPSHLGKASHSATLPQSSRHTAPAPSSPQRVLQAIKSHQVVLVLFYNPAAGEDRALRGELDSLRLPAGVVKVAAPIHGLADYQVITQAVTINQSPTFVLVDRKGRLTTIEGYADPFELSTRVAQALTAG